MRFPVILPSLAFLALAGARASATEADEFFEKRIRPVLAEHCLECHSANEKTKGGLRLDSRADLIAGGDSGTGIVVGDPEKSLLIAAITHRDKEIAMPAKKPKLPAEVIADFEKWVREGAVWPGGEGALAAAAKFDLAGRKARLPWLWQAPQKQSVPVAGSDWARDETDRFIFAKLAEKGLAPAAPADDRTWIRRVHFAITGLSPTRDALRNFLDDPATTRRERAVDSLLASPHFGERWARHWMDLMRYAESRGHEEDYRIANAWRYRDYLIRAFNADLPYDRFVAEHIAGDLLPPRLDAASGGNESVLATGWAFLGEEVHSPVDLRQDECERVDNKVDVLSKTFLGLTVACARCHDHKFDAITQRDYYALSGFVLGSPYRQVRFETMDSHARAAVALADLRAKHVGEIAAAWAKSVRPGLENVAAKLLAARRVILGESVEAAATASGIEPATIAKWSEQLKHAAATPAHALNAFATLAQDPQGDRPERISDWQKTGAPVPIPPTTKVLADFTKAGVTPWKTDGPTFGVRPARAGEVIAGAADQPIARVMPFGAARRDPFWNALKLAPGNEMDAGILGAVGRAGRTLLIPKTTLASGRLHYLLRGKAQVYAGVDSHLMIAGPLHAAMVANFDTAGALRWVTHDLGAYAGHRAHLEIAALPDADLQVLMVVEAPEAPQWLPAMSWRPTSEVATLTAVADELQNSLRAIVDQLAAGRGNVEPALAPLADWLMQNSSLVGAADSSACATSTDFFREQDALAKSIRWESATAVSWADGSGVDESVLIRGKPSRPGAVAPRALPEAFGFPEIAPRDSSGRAELARQMIDPANPLLARVIVNRVWHHLFGRGLVATPDNFGWLGERPTHPELLDHLAWQFVHEDRWSLKRLIKRLALTSTFAMSSRAADARAAEVDPTNALLHRMPVRRLEGEAVRDAVLVVSGRFNPAQFGRPVSMPLTDFTVGRGRPGESGPLDGDGRRSIYIAALRNFLPTMMLAFDFPTPFSTVGRRNVTNVPAQSLVMMNDPFVHEQARVWAARMLRECGAADDGARVTWLFESAYAQPPTTVEIEASLDSLRELRGLQPARPDVEVWSDFCHALLNANDFIYLK